MATSSIRWRRSGCDRGPRCSRPAHVHGDGVAQLKSEAWSPALVERESLAGPMIVGPATIRRRDSRALRRLSPIGSRGSPSTRPARFPGCNATSLVACRRLDDTARNDGTVVERAGARMRRSPSRGRGIWVDWMVDEEEGRRIARDARVRCSRRLPFVPRQRLATSTVRPSPSDSMRWVWASPGRHVGIARRMPATWACRHAPRPASGAEPQREGDERRHRLPARTRGGDAAALVQR